MYILLSFIQSFDQFYIADNCNYILLISQGVEGRFKLPVPPCWRDYMVMKAAANI